MLFLGAAMSITAFPMLARIIYERGLAGSALGTMALAAGAIGDAGVWGVLAIVLASFGDGPLVAVKAIGGGLVFGLFMLTLGRKLLAPLGPAAERAGKVTPVLLAVTLMLFLLGGGPAQWRR
jgi:Kef-type K+ transport system membrane component KefB